MNRRDVLKYFGAGMAIAPLAAGPIVTLVEPPKVELAKALPSDFPIIMRDVRNVTVLFEMADGSHRTMRGDVSYARGIIRGPRSIVEIEALVGVSPHIEGGYAQANCLLL